MGQLEGITTVTDGDGESSSESSVNYSTSLHDAAAHFDAGELARLIQEEGCHVNETDGDGRTALHVLLSDEFRGNLYQPEQDQCIQTLLQSDKCDINARDKSGETPLSLAVHHGLQSAALALVRDKADTSIRTPNYPSEHSLASEISLRMPQVMMSILDSGISHNSQMNKPNQPTEITLDWRPILRYDINHDGATTQINSPPTMTTSKGETKAKKFQLETSFLYSLLDVPKSIRSQYLDHPLVCSFLYFRITKARRRLWLFQLIMVLYPITYLLFVSLFYFVHCEQEEDEEKTYPLPYPVPGYHHHGHDPFDMTNDTEQNKNDTKLLTCDLSGGFLAWGLVLSISVIFFAILDVYMLTIRRDLKYLASWRVWIVRASYVTMGTTFWGPLSFYGYPYKDISWIFPVAALGTFVAFAMLLLQLETIFPPVRVHLEMLAGITIDALKIILLFIPLLGGFYLGFSLMYSNIGGVLNFVLMVVDISSDKYDELRGRAEYSDDESYLWFTTIANGFRIVFIVVISVVFLNFMLGVAISDIPKLKANAKVLSRSQKIQTVFLINIFFPNKLNVVSQVDIAARKWTCSYQPSNEQCQVRRSLPIRIQKRINEFIKSKRNLPNE